MPQIVRRFAASDSRLRTDIGYKDDQLIRAETSGPGIILYGPYIALPAGTYEATIEFDPSVPAKGAAGMDIAVEAGQHVLARRSIEPADLNRGRNTVSLAFSSARPMINVEVRFGSMTGFVGAIRSVTLSGEPTDEAYFEASALPDVPVPDEIRRGRNPHEGYQRGIGLDLAETNTKIKMDPDFHQARELAGSRTIIGDDSLANLFLLLKLYVPRLIPGHIVEFGSYRGGSALFIASVARRFLPEARVLAFDTFEGMPVTNRTIDLHTAGDFTDVDLPELRRYAAQAGLDNLEFVQGRFEDTAADRLKTLGAVALCHIDCDIRSGIETAYTATKPHMVPGGYWVFDDPLVPTCLGAIEAVEDLLIRGDGLSAEQVFPHLVYRKPFDEA